MVNQEILHGLRTALSKNESLQSAMQSFYNAGYQKQEIMEATRELQMELFQAQSNQPPIKQVIQKQPQPQKILPKKIEYKPLEPPPKTEQIQKQPPVQKVSNYDREERDVLTIILIIILILLLGALVTVFIFKQQIVEFLNNLF